MSKYFIIITVLMALLLDAETLFEVKDALNNPVLNVSTDGLRIMNQGDTLMVISSDAVKVNLSNSKDKVLSRTFSVTTATSKKGFANVLEVGTKSTAMREGLLGERYTDFSPENIFLGLNAGIATSPLGTDGTDNVILGNNAGISNYRGKSNLFIGPYSGATNYGGDKNIFIGSHSGYLNSSGNNSIAIGFEAGYKTTASANLFIGNYSGYSNTTGYLNVYLGHNAGYFQGSGFYNVYSGIYSGGNKTSGNNNVFMGSFSGFGNSAGSGNVFIGYNSGYYETGSNKLYIANSDTSTPLIHGDFTNNTLGLGVQASSSYRLDVRSTTNSGNFESSTSTGANTRGLYARAFNGTATNYGIYATASGTGATNYAGFFSGNIRVTGTVTKSDSKTTIDHPTDPENKILTHSSVSSSEMLNVYSGNIVLDGNGKATVEMPEWFEAYNAEFRYQLTGIGSSAPGLFISDELEAGKFGIGGGNPGMKVSWMVTAVRNDNYAKANPVQVVTEKKENEKGYYLTPEAFGRSRDMSIESLYERDTVISISE